MPKIKEKECSFCGKPQNEVRRLIASPSGVYICDECISTCGDIIAEQEESTEVKIQKTETEIQTLNERREMYFKMIKNIDKSIIQENSKLKELKDIQKQNKKAAKPEV